RSAGAAAPGPSRPASRSSCPRRRGCPSTSSTWWASLSPPPSSSGSARRAARPSRPRPRRADAAAPVAFGIFAHVDRSDAPLTTLFEHRRRLAEAADAAGFRTYHVAEHHATRLGLAPSPGIFLAAVAQRTRRLRFGPLVYLLPLYTPLRLIEEICMLDQ